MVPKAKKSAPKKAAKKKTASKKAAKRSSKRSKKTEAAATTEETASTQAPVKKKAAAKKSPRKSTKKKTAKKSVSKKEAAKAAELAMHDIVARARDHFKRAHPDHLFIVHDGRALRDLLDLVEALESMQHDVFHHHVNEHKHDFANWVQEILEEQALAEQLREERGHPEHQQRIVLRHIVRRTW